MMVDAIILAGGMGTRLRQIVPDLPKPMAPVNGMPFLFYLLQWLGKYDVRNVIISAGYRSEEITAYFGNSFGNIELDYAIEEKALGTGGAVMYALSKASGNNILIVNGDTWFPVDLTGLSTFHAGTGSKFTIALKKMENFSRYGTVECRGDIIVRFNEKRFCPSGLINGGIYMAGIKFLEDQHMPEVFSLEKDLLEKKAGTGELMCRVFDDPFIDIGIPEDYLRARDLLK